MKAIVIDDENQAREALCVLLKQYCPHLQLIGTANNGESGLQMLQTLRPDIVFLDVEMPGMDGFEVIRRIDRIDFALIYVTAYEKYAVRAFEFSAMDYLLKPIDPARLIQAVHKASERMRLRGSAGQYQVLLELLNLKDSSPTLDHRIVFATQNEIVFSWLRNLIRVDADQNFSFIKLVDQSQPLRIARNIGEYDKQLEGYEQIMRVHRSHLVNLFQVKKFLPKDCMIVMTDGMKIPVASNRRDELLRRLNSLGLMD